MKNIKIKMNKSVYLYLPILEISKTLMYEFRYNHIKPKYRRMQNYATWIQIVLSFILT